MKEVFSVLGFSVIKMKVNNFWYAIFLKSYNKNNKQYFPIEILF